MTDTDRPAYRDRVEKRKSEGVEETKDTKAPTLSTDHLPPLPADDNDNDLLQEPDEVALMGPIRLEEGTQLLPLPTAPKVTWLAPGRTAPAPPGGPVVSTTPSFSSSSSMNAVATSSPVLVSTSTSATSTSSRVFHYVFALDKSSSMDGPKADALVAGFNRIRGAKLADKQAVADERVSILLFDSTLTWIARHKQWTELEPLGDENYHVGGGTDLHGAMIEVNTQFQKYSNCFLHVFSDGEHSHFPQRKLEAQQSLASLRDRGWVVVLMYEQTDNNTPRFVSTVTPDSSSSSSGSLCTVAMDTENLSSKAYSSSCSSSMKKFRDQMEELGVSSSTSDI